MRAHYINEKHVKAIENNLPDIYRLIWRLMIETGLRVDDAVSLRWADIDKKGYVHYTAKKTGKSARVRLSEDLYSEFREWRSSFGGTSDDFVFCSPTIPDSHITRQAVWKNIKKVCRKLCIDPDGISPHSCRKTFAVKMYKEEGLAPTMAKLQHSSPSTTFLYVFDDNPISKLEKRLNELSAAVNSLRKICDILCDRVFGDDIINLTQKGREAISSPFENK